MSDTPDARHFWHPAAPTHCLFCGMRVGAVFDQVGGDIIKPCTLTVPAERKRLAAATQGMTIRTLRFWWVTVHGKDIGLPPERPIHLSPGT